MIYKITPIDNCRYCHGTGTATEYHPWGDTTAAEYLTCDCITEQLPEEFDEQVDEIDVIGVWDDSNRIIVRDGPDFDWDD